MYPVFTQIEYIVLTICKLVLHEKESVASNGLNALKHFDWWRVTYSELFEYTMSWTPATIMLICYATARRANNTETTSVDKNQKQKPRRCCYCCLLHCGVLRLCRTSWNNNTLLCSIALAIFFVALRSFQETKRKTQQSEICSPPLLIF